MSDNKTPAKRKKLTSIDKIRLSYESDDIILTPKEILLKQYYIEAFTFMSAGNSPMQAANMLYENRNIPISTSLRHVKNSTILFGSVSEMSVRGEKIILKEQLWSLYQQALEKSDREEARKLIQVMSKLLPEDINQLFDHDKMADNDITIEVSKELETQIMEHISKGAINLNGIAEDAEFENM